ncbi:MAG: FAD-dependent monooxygenase [Candidatus Omnitrophica bacterium]|nr:FAD-dependent monooxygenase [Candidatus Omnitrophota bacterium]
MFLIKNLKLAFDHNELDLKKAIAAALNIEIKHINQYELKRKSIDARSKTRICFVYSLAVTVNDLIANTIVVDQKNISRYEPIVYNLPAKRGKLKQNPLIIGAGPAGLFSALLLAEAGFAPLLIEQGKDVDARRADIKQFFTQGKLDQQSNIQFGEGGAGTFSDGKLYTLINDKRSQKVFDVFLQAGAPAEILYSAKPHIGTDKLSLVVKNLRKKIIALGGQIKFDTKITDFIIENNKVTAAISADNQVFKSEIIILALGGSARETFALLHKKGVRLQSKPFSIGARIEHPQSLISKVKYHDFYNESRLGPAEYKLVHHAANKRSVYSFCMCPGGAVVASSSENGGIVTNGMSEFARDKQNANSAIVVAVKPEDFGSEHPLAGIEFQRKWENLAFKAGGSNFYAPAQLVGDFLHNKPSKQLGSVQPSYAPGILLGDLTQCLPEFVTDTIKHGLLEFDKKIKGFAMPDAVLTGVETRTSSPVRVLRNEQYCSSIKGLYPIGEGAGYAGGIVSAALDGIKAVEEILQS